MNAIILAAGMSRRFGEYLNGRPKCLLELDGVSLLQRNISLLRANGIDEISIVKGFRADLVSASRTRSFINLNYASTNMVTSLFCAEEAIRGDVIITYADIAYEAHILNRMMGELRCHIGVAIDLNWKNYYRARYEDPFIEAESLVFDTDFRIREIGAASPPIDKVQGQYIGLIRLDDYGSSVFLDYYSRFKQSPSDANFMRGRTLDQAYMTDFLQALIDEGVEIHALPMEGGWLEFDTPDDYERVKAWKRAGILDKICHLK
jgi:L-glutamine-phosphate cytidylyltransferase